MTNRRVDSICFALLLAGCLVVLLASTVFEGSTSSPSASALEIPDLEPRFELPSVAMPDPWRAFRPTFVYKTPRISRPRFGDEVESALFEVRSKLLVSSIPTELARVE